MELIILILILILLFGLAVGLVYLFVTSRKQSANNDPAAQKMILEIIDGLRREVADSSTKNRQEIQQNLSNMSQQLMTGLTNTSQMLQKQFGQSAGIIKDVTEKLVNLNETNKQVLDFSKQLQSLENILRNPKQRSVLSEYWLEVLMGNVLQPNQYQMQYKFKNGDIVDAAIFYRDKIIPIDAKFSLEKYNKITDENDPVRRSQLEKEFKGHIKDRIDETSKYIRPLENTTEFAFMFIPAEGIYYNLLIYRTGTIEISAHDLVEYAFKKHVIIVSPTSFFAYLETVLQGLKAVKTEENIKVIIAKVGELSKHLANYETFIQKLGGSLDTTVNQYNQAYKEFGKIDKDIYKITEGNAEIKATPLLIERTIKDEL